MGALSAGFENKSKEGTVEMMSDDMEFWEENFFKISCSNPPWNPLMHCHASEIGGNLIPLTLSLPWTAVSSYPILPFQSTALFS